MKIPVVVGNATYAKISCADFTGIGMIEPPREGPLNRAKVLIAGIVKHALRGCFENLCDCQQRYLCEDELC